MYRFSYKLESGIFLQLFDTLTLTTQKGFASNISSQRSNDQCSKYTLQPLAMGSKILTQSIYSNLAQVKSSPSYSARGKCYQGTVTASQYHIQTVRTPACAGIKLDH